MKGGILYICLIFTSKGPFLLQSVNTGQFIGNIDNHPRMVDRVHGINFDIRTDSEHKSSLCTESLCLMTHDIQNLEFSDHHSSKFLITENSDNSYSFIFKKNCLQEKNGRVIVDECGELDRFYKVYLEDDNPEKESLIPTSDIVFNFGVDDGIHRRDSIIKMKQSEENYTLVPRNRHHNSHTHRVGGFGDKAYYTYFSYHPSSRHSAYNFHGFHHGIPKSWKNE